MHVRWEIRCVGRGVSLRSTPRYRLGWLRHRGGVLRKLQRLAQRLRLTRYKAFQQSCDFEVAGDAVMHFVSVA